MLNWSLFATVKTVTSDLFMKAFMYCDLGEHDVFMCVIECVRRFQNKVYTDAGRGAGIRLTKFDHTWVSCDTEDVWLSVCMHVFECI